MPRYRESNPGTFQPFYPDGDDGATLPGRRDCAGDNSGGDLSKDGQAGRDPVPGSLPALPTAEDPRFRETVLKHYRECGRILSLLSVHHSGPGGFFSQLDEMSRALLLQLAIRGYANLDEMSRATGSTHYEVLYRLQEVIIPASIRHLKRPVVLFRESGIDPLSGGNVLFSWWLNNECPGTSGRTEVTEDEDAVYITVELPGVELPHEFPVLVTFNHGIIEVKVRKGGDRNEKR